MAQTPENLLTFANPAQWRAWLEEHHASAAEAWLRHYRKQVGRPGLTYEQGVEEALCFGWIDGLLRKVDDESYALRYTPRKPRSVWAASNKQRVEKLIREGRMAPAGLAKVAAAKASGEWEAATAREDVDTIPADLAAVLDRHQARAAFEAWPPSHRKQYLYWLESAKKPETRQKRIQAIVEAATTGKLPPRTGG
jgi:uncharacterized protein YdeI (YjbR/CyaY-like superfamily)